jgi:hypothetical protein
MSEEHKRALSIANRGKGRPPISEETRVKMSAARKGKPAANAGKKHSEEARRKISEARKRYLSKVL